MKPIPTLYYPVESSGRLGRKTLRATPNFTQKKQQLPETNGCQEILGSYPSERNKQRVKNKGHRIIYL
jgi:hypothetical protein